MNKYIPVFVLMFCTFLNGCRAGSPVIINWESESTSLVQNQAALNFSPVAGKAILYLYVDKPIPLTGFRVSHHFLGEIMSGFYRIELNPGAYSVATTWLDPPNEIFYEFEIYAEEGRIYYLHYYSDTAEHTVKDARRAMQEIRSAVSKEFTMKSAEVAQKQIRDLQLKKMFAHHFTNKEWKKEVPALLSSLCQTKNIDAACVDLAEKYPNHHYTNQATSRLNEIEKDATQKQFARKFKQDSGLPLDVRRDKYMVALATHLKNERYAEALEYFNYLERLNIKLDPSFNYFYGESLLRTGQSKLAINKFYAYIKENGSKGKYYTKALELVNEAEAKASR